MTFFADTWHIFVRQTRSTLRAPTFVVMAILQPILWLLLFGELFGAVTRLPEFDSPSYIQFLAPGLAIMTSLFGATFAGMGIIFDIDGGMLNRFLATAVGRNAIIFGRLVETAVTSTLQAMILVVAAFVLGARPAGLTGVVGLVVAVCLFATTLAAVSKALAFVLRRPEVLMAVTNFFVLPLVFTSSMIMTPTLMPDWIRVVSRFNPVDWAVLAARHSFEGHGLEQSGIYFLGLAILAVVCWLLAVVALRKYARSQ